MIYSITILQLVGSILKEIKLDNCNVSVSRVCLHECNNFNVFITYFNDILHTHATDKKIREVLILILG